MVPDGKRGDLGTITLKKGVTVTGRVFDVQGKPLAGLFVEAERERGSGPDCEILGQLMVADAIRRTAETDAEGRFTFDPLPPGAYRVMPSEPTATATGGRQWTRRDLARGLRPAEADDQGGRDPRAAGGPRLARTS